ncbi:MAG: thioredoxin family protein [Kiritimatiellae bacterium]|nr:thioredoxin family protein [Kiritimatiellia bacterium]
MKKNVKLFTLLILALGLSVFSGCSKESGANEGGKATALPRLLDLGAHKCSACQKMTPILDELTREYKGVLEVEFIDVWQSENKERAMTYKIETIPTQIFFAADGKELWRHVGFISKEEILAKWKELGYDFKEPAGGGSPASSSAGSMANER